MPIVVREKQDPTTKAGLITSLVLVGVLIAGFMLATCMYNERQQRALAERARQQHRFDPGHLRLRTSQQSTSSSGIQDPSDFERGRQLDRGSPYQTRLANINTTASITSDVSIPEQVHIRTASTASPSSTTGQHCRTVAQIIHDHRLAGPGPGSLSIYESALRQQDPGNATSVEESTVLPQLTTTSSTTRPATHASTVESSSSGSFGVHQASNGDKRGQSNRATLA